MRLKRIFAIYSYIVWGFCFMPLPQIFGLRDLLGGRFGTYIGNNKLDYPFT